MAFEALPMPGTPRHLACQFMCGEKLEISSEPEQLPVLNGSGEIEVRDAGFPLSEHAIPVSGNRFAIPVSN